MSKGGARRFSVPPVDMDALQGIIDRAVGSKGAAAFLLGEYDTKKVTTAMSAAGLHQNAAWVKDFYPYLKRRDLGRATEAVHSKIWSLPQHQ